MNQDYINYIRNPDNYTKLEIVNINGRGTQIISFKGENPGEFADFRDTTVTILEQEDTIIVIKKTLAFGLDIEFKEILKTIRFY